MATSATGLARRKIGNWKVARISPIYKQKGKRTDCNSYRPISCLSVPSKILETCAKIQIVNFFEANKLFAKSQHGFRNKRSTMSALISMNNTWLNALDKKKFAGVLSFDLSSAFDSIDQSILCDKLSLYGFDHTSLSWVKSYLTNRSQYVQIGPNASTLAFIITGSPQGSCISPIFFIILIADIDEWTCHAIIDGFADDNNATVVGDEISDVVKKLEEDAGNILSFRAHVHEDFCAKFVEYAQKIQRNATVLLH